MPYYYSPKLMVDTRPINGKLETLHKVQLVYTPNVDLKLKFLLK